VADSHTDGQEHSTPATPSGQEPGAEQEAAQRGLQQALCRERRLQALRRTALLDTSAEEAFDRLARLAVRVTRAPAALVTLVDQDRQFFKSCVGLPPPWCDVRQTPLTHSFCMHVVASCAPLVIEDARLHPVLRENLAIDQLGVVAYAGVPLITSEGEAIGTFCTIDTQPRVWTEDDLALLQDLATSVMTEIELRANHALAAQALEAEAARQRFSLLAELSAVLARGFDIQAALERAARLVVPLVADGCMVELLEERGRLRRAVTHLGESAAAELHSQPESFALLPSESKDEASVLGHFRLTEPEGSTLRLPLTSHGQVLGAVTFTTTPPRLPGEVEMSLAREVTRRMALAVESARLYQESREALQLRDRFLSIASHELRTPLTALRLHAQSLLRCLKRPARPLTWAEVERKVRGVAYQAERLEHLVDELLDLSRISEGRLSFQLEDVDLTEVVREVTARLGEEAARAGSALALRGLEAPVVGGWNRLRLEQVVTNLLTNAIKYGEGRPITLEVRADADTAWIAVHDEGIGIASQDHGRIFERFERAVSEQHYSGFGLGLWIVREITHRLGGSIFVDSAPGAGSTFTVELPRNPAQAPAPLLH
jgi:signal transduction histidine kinase